MRVPSAGTWQDRAAAPSRMSHWAGGQGLRPERSSHLQSPLSNPSLGQKGRVSSLETPWMNEVLHTKITAEKSCRNVLDSSPHVPEGLCSCRDKSLHISGFLFDRLGFFVHNSRGAACKTTAFPVDPIFFSQWQEFTVGSAKSAVGVWSGAEVYF